VSEFRILKKKKFGAKRHQKEIKNVAEGKRAMTLNTGKDKPETVMPVFPQVLGVFFK